MHKVQNNWVHAPGVPRLKHIFSTYTIPTKDNGLVNLEWWWWGGVIYDCGGGLKSGVDKRPRNRRTRANDFSPES